MTARYSGERNTGLSHSPASCLETQIFTYQMHFKIKFPSSCSFYGSTLFFIFVLLMHQPRPSEKLLLGAVFLNSSRLQFLKAVLYNYVVIYCNRLSKIQGVGSGRPFLHSVVESHHQRLGNASCYKFYTSYPLFYRIIFIICKIESIKFVNLVQYFVLAYNPMLLLNDVLSRFLWNSEGVNLHQSHCSGTTVYCQQQPLLKFSNVLFCSEKDVRPCSLSIFRRNKKKRVFFYAVHKLNIEMLL